MPWLCHSTHAHVSLKTGPLTPAPHSLHALSVPLMPRGYLNHPHQPGQCEATCPSFAQHPFQKGDFCKPKSDLRSLSPASQSSSVILGHCHLFGEASTDRIPAPAPCVCSLVSFPALSFTLCAEGRSGLGTRWVLSRRSGPPCAMQGLRSRWKASPLAQAL